MKKNKIILTTLSPKTHRTSEENLGIEYLKSSLIKNKFDVEIIDAWLNELDVDEVFDAIVKQKDDILFVGISSYMSNTKYTIDLINRLKKYDIKIACGGFGPTFYPNDYLLNGADYVMRGEGEETIVDLAKCLKNDIPVSGIKSLGYKKNGEIIINNMRNLLDNLDELSFPSRDFLNRVLEKKSTVNMISSRGCSGNCDFCSVIAFFRLTNGKVWRTRSIQNIVDEIEQLYNQNVKYIKMVDDSFIDGCRDEKWCEQFANEIERRNIKVKLRGQIRADKVSDEILYHLKRAGFYSFACGIENGSQTALSRMSKSANIYQNYNALELFKKHDYLVQMGFILFDKYTTMQELQENYEFLKKYDFAVTKGIFSEMFSAQGTKLNDRLKKNNQLIETDFINNNNKYDIDEYKVKCVYDSLKTWHRSHSEIYDMTIDPLIAPKAIEDEYIDSLYKYVMKLKNIDLQVFNDILNIVNNDGENNLSDYLNDKIYSTAVEYDDIKKDVTKIYVKTKLEYNADKNPFI